MGCLRGAHYQASVLDAFCTDQAVCQFLHVSRLAPKYDHLETAIVVQVCVQCGDDDVMMLVLEIGKLLG